MSGRYAARRPRGLSAEEIAGRKKEYDTNRALEFFAAATQRQKELGFPLKHHKPHVTRMMSPRQQGAFSMTNDIRRSIFRSTEKAEQDWSRIKPGDESIMTRNVGPKDFGTNYIHGKDTGYTGVRWGKPER